MMHDVLIRPAVMSERQAPELLQRRASLYNPGDREALLDNPDAIELPLDQIAAGQVFVAERDGAIVGFPPCGPREDPEMDLDGLFVEPHLWGHGIGRLLVEHSRRFCSGARVRRPSCGRESARGRVLQGVRLRDARNRRYPFWRRPVIPTNVVVLLIQ